MYRNEEIVALHCNRVFKCQTWIIWAIVLQNYCKILKNYFSDMLSLTRKAYSQTLASCHI